MVVPSVQSISLRVPCRRCGRALRRLGRQDSPVCWAVLLPRRNLYTPPFLRPFCPLFSPSPHRIPFQVCAWHLETL